MKNVKFGFLATSVAASLAFCASAQASGGGPFGGTIVGLTADPVTTTRVYAATSNGFFRSDDSGATWAVAETGLAVAHPSNGVYVTVPGVSGGLVLFDDAGHLYRSSDAGATWTATGYTAPVAPGAGLESLAVGSGSTLWFAANTGGLLTSADSGATFVAAAGGFPAGATVTIVATNPSDPTKVIAGLNSSCDSSPTGTGACPIYVSATGGASWTAIANPPGTTAAGESRHLTAVAFGPGTTVYALYGDPNYGDVSLISSSDNGAHWTAHAQYGASLAASPSDANTLWVDANKSTNGGVSFVPLATTGRMTNGVFVPGTSAIAVPANYPASPEVWIGTFYAGVYASSDDGAHWAPANQGIAATDIRALAIHPADTTHIYAGYGDALSDPSPALYTSQPGGTWNVTNTTLNAYQLRTVLLDPTTTGTIAGTTMYTVGTGFDWSGGVRGSHNSGIYKSTDGGTTWTTENGGIPTQGATGHYAGFLRTIIADPRSCDTRASTAPLCTTGPLKTLYVTGGGRPNGTGAHPYRIMKSIDGGVTWADSSTGLPNDIINADGSEDLVSGVTPIIMDPTDSNILYIGTFADAFDASGASVTPQNASGVYKSIDGGAHWTLSSTGLPTYTGSPAVLDTLSLAIDPANHLNLWVSTIDNSFSPSSPGQIYKSTDGGASWSISNSGVTGPDVRALLVDPTHPGTIYAASGGLGPANPGGVYKSTDGGANWISISVGLPAFSATALALDPSDSTILFAGTTGGVYSLVQLPDSDADGVPDAVENAGPNGGDANHDGTPDAQQHSVSTSSANLVGSYGWQPGIPPSARPAELAAKLAGPRPQTGPTGYFTVAVNGSTCGQAVDVAPVDPATVSADTVPHHGTYTYPDGIVRFELPRCGSANVDIVFDAASFGSGWSWRYFGPSTPGDDTTMGWHDATSLVLSRSGGDWKIALANGAFGSYRPAATNSILFVGGPAYNDTLFTDGFQ